MTIAIDFAECQFAELLAPVAPESQTVQKGTEG